MILDKVLRSRELSFPMRAALFTAFNLEMLAGVLRSTPDHAAATTEDQAKVCARPLHLPLALSISHPLSLCQSPFGASRWC